MRDQAIGRLCHLVRRRRRLRQSDVARAAGVSQGTVSLLERGHLDLLTVRTARRIAAALEIELAAEARWRGPSLDRLADAAHASQVDVVVGILRDLAWAVRAEVGVSRFGERGVIDVAAWHPATRSLLIIEVKTRLVDIQESLATLDRKRRIGPPELAADLGWRARRIGVVLAVAGDRTARRVVERHGATFDAALPARTRAVRRWISSPVGDLRGVWFLTDSSRVRAAPLRANREAASGGSNRPTRARAGRDADPCQPDRGHRPAAGSPPTNTADD